MTKFYCRRHQELRHHGLFSRWRGLKLNISTFNIVGAGLLFFGVLAYLIQINGLATSGYQIKDLETKLAQLEQQNSRLTVEKLKLESLDAVRNRVVSLNMVATGQFDYLSADNVAVAANR